MAHRTRDSDNKDPREIAEILRRRGTNGRETRKILFLIIAIFVAISGFFFTRWINAQELTDTNILKKAYTYTDTSIIRHETKTEPYLRRIEKNENMVRRMALNIERIGLIEVVQIPLLRLNLLERDLGLRGQTFDLLQESCHLRPLGSPRLEMLKWEMP